jgi:hypothetical protein
MKALWRPAWYELDQDLEVDLEDEFAFCRTPPSGVAPGFDFVFHTVLLDRGEPALRRAKILRIMHSVLGDVQRVETTGLVYTMTLTDGSVIRVEAEETPGAIEVTPGRRSPTIVSWDLEVDVEITS